jgi:hypothetical protein
MNQCPIKKRRQLPTPRRKNQKRRTNATFHLGIKSNTCLARGELLISLNALAPRSSASGSNPLEEAVLDPDWSDEWDPGTFAAGPAGGAAGALEGKKNRPSAYATSDVIAETAAAVTAAVAADARTRRHMCKKLSGSVKARF